jgi:hypothetical protein
MPAPPAAATPRAAVPTGGRTRGRRRRSLVVLFALLVSPLVAELVVRFELGDIVVLHSEVGALYDPAPPPFGYRLRPSGGSRVTYARRSGDVVRAVDMTVNAAGYRGPLIGTGRPRIVCIGDSHTFGYGVGDDATWPSVVARTLRDAGPAGAGLAGVEVSGAEVANLGVGGYDPLRELARLEQDGFVLEPDVVLWQWFANDVPDGPGAAVERTASSRLANWTSPWRQGWLGALRARSRLVDLVLHAAHVRARHAACNFDALAGRLDTLPAWGDVVASIRAARAGCEARGIGFAVVVFPLLVRDGGVFVSARLDAAVVALCRSEGIPVIDLSGEFGELTAERLCNSLLDYHASSEAHRVAGEAIARGVVTAGLVPSAPNRGAAVR